MVTDSAVTFLDQDQPSLLMMTLDDKMNPTGPYVESLNTTLTLDLAIWSKHYSTWEFNRFGISGFVSWGNSTG